MILKGAYNQTYVKSSGIVPLVMIRSYGALNGIGRPNVIMRLGQQAKLKCDSIVNW